MATLANTHRAAQRAGHGVAIAVSRNADLVEVPRGARTLEAAMQIEAEIEQVIAATEQQRNLIPGVALPVARVPLPSSVVLGEKPFDVHTPLRRAAHVLVVEHFERAQRDTNVLF